jgi:hypothetical protein
MTASSPGERHCASPTRVFIEFHAPGEESRDYEILHHTAIHELVLNGYAWFGQASSRSLLKWSVGRRTWCLPLRVAVMTCGSAFRGVAAASSICPPPLCGWRREPSLGLSLGGGEVHHQDPLCLERGLVPRRLVRLCRCAASCSALAC